MVALSFLLLIVYLSSNINFSAQFPNLWQTVERSQWPSRNNSPVWEESDGSSTTSSITFPSPSPSLPNRLLQDQSASLLQNWKNERPTKTSSYYSLFQDQFFALDLDPTTATPTEAPAVTYVPGELTKQEHDLLLSTGLTSRIIARVHEAVVVSNNGNDADRPPFHIFADFGATFLDDRPENPGGMIYVSNSENRNLTEGGVGAITFDKNYNIIDYQMILKNTTANCGGGRTPWGSWISCEETRWGQAWQVDPTGRRPSRVITLGSDYGHFESFAYDIRNLDDAHFFITEDAPRGPIQRFTPHNPNWQDPWNILYGTGDIHYLLLYPDDNETYYTGRYEWTTDKNVARDNTELYYPHCEGIDVAGSQLFFVSKRTRTIYTLDLDGDTYTNKTTRRGLFDGAPDQIARVLGHEDLLYFTEEGGRDPGVHARNALGQYFTIFESPVYNDETTGLAFSPDGTRMYVAFQVTGVLYEIRREDGYPFHEKNLNVKYHNEPF